MAKTQFSLLELNQLIKEQIKDNLSYTYWVSAEISELHENHSGHCYLELIEKDKDTDHIKARARATIWAYSYRMIKPFFETTTNTIFSEGIKVLINVSVEFHEIYGFSLNIRDIDPTYTVGDLALKRAKIITKLEQEGVIDMNKDINLPIVIKRVAIISSETAAGYGDFKDQLLNNSFEYVFTTKLFNAVMQGKEAANSIISALEQIYESEKDFDVIIIIRGGGAKADLVCFDDYWLAYHIAQFPIPILSGIGHERDDTVVDLVAHMSLKTPTAVAEFIIENNYAFDNYLKALEGRLYDATKECLAVQKDRLKNVYSVFPLLIRSKIQNSTSLLTKNVFLLQKVVNEFFSVSNENLKHLNQKVKTETREYCIQKDFLLSQQKLTLNNSVSNILLRLKNDLETKVTVLNYIDPTNVLNRGYSVTKKDNVLIKNVSKLQPNDIISVQLYKGTVKALVKSTEK